MSNSKKFTSLKEHSLREEMPLNSRRIIVKDIIIEDFINYKKPCMTIAFPHCTFKCEKECGIQCCQNSALAQSPDIEISIEKVINLYINNPITQAVCCQGLEPFDDWGGLIIFIREFRKYSDDDIVIYTGYYEYEIFPLIDSLKANYTNIVVKFGRFIPDQQPHYDEVLGVKLASDNQKGVRIC